MSNQAIAKHLELIAQLRSLNNDNPYSVAAFNNAAKLIASLGIDLQEINPITLPGIGAKIYQEIKDFLKTGTTIRYQYLLDRFPIEMFSMTAVHGIGAKRAHLLYQKGYHNFEELHQAALNNQLDDKLRDAVLFAGAKQQGRVLYQQAYPIAVKIQTALANLQCGQVEITGSLRRKLPTIKDIDLAICLNDPSHKQKVIDHFTAFGAKLSGAGTKYSIQVIGNNFLIQADLWLGNSSYWGTLLNHTTGSKEHNIAIRSLAKTKGLTISEYGIFRDDQKIGGEEESDLYRILDLPYVSPENRTGVLPTP